MNTLPCEGSPMHFLLADQALPGHALRLANTDDVLARADEIRLHDTVVLHFPNWTDGRAYSQAVLLRGRVRYAGAIVASGDVVADMAPLLRRCGFDGAQLRADQRLETAQRTLGHFDSHYQHSLAERHLEDEAVAVAAAAAAATRTGAP
jgi:uncharacterized protein (DUF934 family)